MSNNDGNRCFNCAEMQSHWNIYMMIRVPEKEEYTMLLCDKCSNTFVARMKQKREEEEGFAEYEQALRKVDWCRMWKHEQEEWDKLR
jgi:hypothetical protein